MEKLKTTNHNKHLLLYHIIFSTKYRRKMFFNKSFCDSIKEYSLAAANRANFRILYMELDKDHIHYMIELKASSSISRAVRFLKQYTTFYSWKNHRDLLSKFYYSNRYLWTRGYFSSSIGNLSQETLKNYILNQC